MNQTAMPHGTEPREILQDLVEKKVPAVMSYLSKGKWHVAKVVLTELGANRLTAQISSGKKPHPMHIQVNQPVGISVKYEYGKFIFETAVAALGPPSDSDDSSSGEPQNNNHAASGGTIELMVPDRVEIVQRRSYFRVDVPKSLKVNVMFWHRCLNGKQRTPPEHYWQGKLADISAGGAQIVVDAGPGPKLKTGQFIGMRFTPMPYETPLTFDAQIRNVLPTADNQGMCLGLQIVGLEASPEGRQILQRLCNIVERYYRINQSSAKERDFQPTSAQTNPAL
ncbi:MAG: PilZ domain-containing protein [Planctomycetota bacterium]|nr:MAG: PilZ domain-containing protein [Planctomycetota bacterium]